MLWRRYEDWPMIAARKAGWHNQVRMARLLVCSALVTAACSTSISNINGGCNGQGGSNTTNCDQPGNSAAGSTSAADSAAGSGSVAKTTPVLTTVQVAAGSEDLLFLRDPRVVARFAKLGLKVAASPFGSGVLAETLSPNGYNAFFVSSQVFADLAQLRLHRTLPEPQPFSTPLEVFTWKELLRPLRALGIIDSAGRFDIGNYLAVVDQGMRWNQVSGDPLPGNSTQVVLWMTNPSQSDSGAMFVAAASYVLNGANVVSGKTNLGAIAGKVARAIIPLGEMPTTTNQAFQDYLRDGKYGRPMVLGYQSESGQLPADGVALPLNYTVNCEHTVLPFDPLGARFASLLNDPVLQQLAMKDGFETTQPSAAASDIPIPLAPFLKELTDDIATDDNAPQP
jgi:hypothetical protein